MSGLLSSGSHEQRQAIASVEDAKRDLLDWGVRADVELQQQATASLAAVTASAKSLLPWAAIGATGIGLLIPLLGRGRKARPKGSFLGTVIRGAIGAWPIVSEMLRSRKQES